MKLTSNWTKGNVFWRTFMPQDTVYMFGLREGYLSTDQSLVYENPTGMFQMELKRGDIWGPFIVTAGHQYANTDEMVLQDDGSIVTLEQSLKIVIDPGFKFESYGSVAQFFAAGAADSSIKVTSSLTQTTNSSIGDTTTVSSRATMEVGGTVGGTVSVNGGSDVKVGVNVTGSASSKVTNEVARVVVTSLNVQMSTATTYAEEQSITLKAKKLTAVVSTWQRRFVTGTVRMGQLSLPFDVTLGYLSSREITEYDSATELPPQLMSQYKEQHPDWTPTGRPATGNTLRAGESLSPGSSLTSLNGKYVFRYQTDGNLVLYAVSAPLWAPWDTNRPPAGSCIMQEDGNLVVYAPGAHPVFATNTQGHPGSRLVMQDGGNVVVIRPNNVPLWATGTNR